MLLPGSDLQAYQINASGNEGERSAAASRPNDVRLAEGAVTYNGRREDRAQAVHLQAVIDL